MENNLKTAIENFLYSDSKKATAAKFILMTLALGGIVFAGAVVPAIFSAIEKNKRYGRTFSRKKLQSAISILKYRKLIEIQEENKNKIKVQLTNKGEKSIKEFCLETMEIKKPKKWDGKWRVLIFDIPSNPKIYNKAREALRDKIKLLGFVQLQKSTWIYPYECEDEILLLAEIYNVQKFIEILTVEKMLYSEKFEKKFKL